MTPPPATPPREILSTLRALAGERLTEGLPEDLLAPFLDSDPTLAAALSEALAARRTAGADFGALLAGPEGALLAAAQAGYINFYAPASVNPYLALAARGPWIVTSHGAVIHDSGGYGMLGLGHAPQALLEVMAAPHVMANVMTPSLSQARLMRRLTAEIGHTRGACPFAGFQCLNSGSESVTLAMRIADINARRQTAPGARHAGRKVKLLALDDGFHGRTQRPALASDSTRRAYRKHLRTHVERDVLWTVPSNDVAALEATFDRAEAQGVFFELMLVEPVQGEGNPGSALSRPFYDAARRLTRAHGSLLLVDSIQAGLRATGALSIVDYPGFEGCDPPDFETYSKALNAGQYPLSVLALGPGAVDLYEVGIYGNTMTTNPRALEVACAVLDALTPALRENIRARGTEFLAGLEALRAALPEGAITQVQGTGLLFSAELRPDIPVIGFDGVEVWLRKRGIGVIHGGENSLRFTPHFQISSAEVALMLEMVRRGIAAFAC